MTLASERPFLLFAFALREGDWPLAGLLANALGRDAAGRIRLERELKRMSRGPGHSPSLVGVRTVGRLVRSLGLEGQV